LSISRAESLKRTSESLGMELFSEGQKWVMTDAVFGTWFGEVIDVSDEGRSGEIVITDEQGNVIDTFTGIATDFQASGEWQLIDE
jgi:hypothetical protein